MTIINGTNVNVMEPLGFPIADIDSRLKSLHNTKIKICVGLTNGGSSYVVSFLLESVYKNSFTIVGKWLDLLSPYNNNHRSWLSDTGLISY